MSTTKKFIPSVTLDLGFMLDALKVEFEGFRLSKEKDGWNCVFYTRDAKGKAFYAMTTQESPEEAFSKLWEAVCSDLGDVLWRKDKFR